MKYCAAYYSDIGIQKETNQDSLLLVQRGQTQDDEAVLAVICDGVGGLKMGERSSAAVVTAFRDWFDERVEELYEQEEPETELFDDWDNLIQSLHIRLKDNSEKAGFRSGTCSFYERSVLHLPCRRLPDIYHFGYPHATYDRSYHRPA